MSMGISEHAENRVLEALDSLRSGTSIEVAVELGKDKAVGETMCHIEVCFALLRLVVTGRAEYRDGVYHKVEAKE